MPENKEIYFLFYEKANFPVILPVINDLMEDGYTPFFLKGFDYKEYVEEISPLNIPSHIIFKGIEDFLSPQDIRDAEKKAAALLPKLRVCKDTKNTFGDDMLYALWAEVWHRKWLPEVLVEYFKVAEGLKHFIDRYTPEYVIIPEDTDYIRGRLAASLLKQYGIKTIVLYPYYYQMFLSYPLVGKRLADYYLVANRHMKERICMQGVADSCVHIVGNSAFDTLANIPSPSAGEKGHFLFAMQGIEWEGEILKDLIEIFAGRPDKHLYIKPHPEKSTQVKEPMPANVTFVQESIHTLLERCNTVIAQSSTVLYQAVLTGRRVIIPCYGFGIPEIFLPDEVYRCSVVRGKKEMQGAIDNDTVPLIKKDSVAAYFPDATRRVKEMIVRIAF